MGLAKDGYDIEIGDYWQIDCAGCGAVSGSHADTREQAEAELRANRWWIDGNHTLCGYCAARSGRKAR